MTISTQLKTYLDPVMTSFGFSPGVIMHRKGTDFVTRLHYKGRDVLELGLDSLHPTADIYLEDMYPNANGEAFMHCFNCIGSSSKAKDLTAYLKSHGIAARSTTHKTYKGIRFDFPLNWETI